MIRWEIWTNDRETKVVSHFIYRRFWTNAASSPQNPLRHRRSYRRFATVSSSRSREHTIEETLFADAPIHQIDVHEEEIESSENTAANKQSRQRIKRQTPTDSVPLVEFHDALSQSIGSNSEMGQHSWDLSVHTMNDCTYVSSRVRKSFLVYFHSNQLESIALNFIKHQARSPIRKQSGDSLSRIPGMGYPVTERQTLRADQSSVYSWEKGFVQFQSKKKEERRSRRNSALVQHCRVHTFLFDIIHWKIVVAVVHHLWNTGWCTKETNNWFIQRSRSVIREQDQEIGRRVPRPRR